MEKNKGKGRNGEKEEKYYSLQVDPAFLINSALKDTVLLAVEGDKRHPISVSEA